ncbi:MAG: response regulator [Spirochaetes bacterium]|nr:response regulator [Spirochaetota bacterium]
MKHTATMAFICFLLFSPCGPFARAGDEPKVLRGVINAGSWDFQRQGPLELSGEWEFYPGRLLDPQETRKPRVAEYINVPGIWNGRIGKGEKLTGEGCATYRLILEIPQWDAPRIGEDLALMVHGVGTAYSIFVNGRPMGHAGRVGVSRETTAPGYRPAIYKCVPEGGRAEILIHVSNFHHRKGGVWEKISMGPETMIREGREGRMARDFFLFGSIVLMGAYHLLLFALRRKDPSYLFFGIFCLLIAVRILVTGEYYALHLAEWLPWETVIGVEYLSFYASVPFFFLFMRSLFFREFSRKALGAILVLGGAFSIIVVTTPPRLYTHTIQAYQVVSTVICCYGLAVLARAVARKRVGALPFAAGFIVLFATVINDVLRNNMLIQTDYLVPLGLFGFIFSQAFLLSARFSRSIAAVEGLTVELERKNMRLLDLDRMKDDLLAAVSHELKTPLNGIIGLTESMRERRVGGATGEDYAVLDMINASGRRLAVMVNDLLDYSRLKYREAPLDRKPVALYMIADLVIELTRPLAGMKSLEIINAIDPEAPRVSADEYRLQQVLHNLIGNAVKYTVSGSVTISMKEKEGRWAEVSVSDTGVGIEPEKHDSVFDLYEKGDGAAGLTQGGTGIGLAIVRRIVELHGGTVRIESPPGGGSVFIFTLPLHEEKASPRDGGSSTVMVQPKRTPASPGDADGDGCTDAGRILVVDDDVVNLEVVKRFLHGASYRVVTAPGGAEALACLESGIFDLVLLDVMMPGMSGHELCRELRKRFSLHELPVIMLTARHGVPDLLAGFENGANDYLAKPVHREELLARVRTLVMLRRTVREHAEARYRLLQERMSPHFLFNALNSVHAMLARDAAMADRALMMLADNYRFIIDHSFHSLISFDREWCFVGNYLEFEGLRFRDTLSVTMERRGDFDGVRVPPLIIQPLVENALKHGVFRRGGRGVVEVIADCNGEKVLVIVRDNGPGLAGSAIFSRSLGNIRNRLEHCFRAVNVSVNEYRGEGVVVSLSFSIDRPPETAGGRGESSCMMKTSMMC